MNRRSRIASVWKKNPHPGSFPAYRGEGGITEEAHDGSYPRDGIWCCWSRARFAAAPDDGLQEEQARGGELQPGAAAGEAGAAEDQAGGVSGFLEIDVEPERDGAVGGC